nr:hypothetical protein [Tanacetum cinerariifolium]
MIAFLTKSDVSEGFDQIVDFLNAHTIQYALMVNLTIYVSCIKQFWASVSIKKSNDVMKLQALIDRKKRFFAELPRMGYEKPSTKFIFYKVFFSAKWKFLIHTIVQCMRTRRTAWNEFSSSMASAVICLATGRKFNFSKYIFDSMVGNMDSPSKFLMYSRFLQVMINAQVDDLFYNNTKYTSPALTQKVFANMRKIGKGFLGVEIPLFDNMFVQQVQVDAEVEEDEDNEALEIIKLKQRVRKLENKRRTKHSGLNRLRKGKIAELDADEDVTLVDVDAKVEMHDNIPGRMDTDEAEPAKVEEVLKVVTTAKFMTEVVTIDAPITTAAQVPKASAPRRRRGFVIQDPKETAVTSVIMHLEVQSKDKGKEILIEEPKPLKGQAQIDVDEAFARQMEAELNANINWHDIIEQVKRSEKKGKSLEEKIAKKQRMDEEAEELKRHLQIVANDDDDVYIEATPLASKLVKERFKSTEPKNFSDDFLLNILKIMFENPNVEANKKYPLTHFTLEQMLNNVRLEVEEESKISLELMRLVRRQLNEGYEPE